MKGGVFTEEEIETARRTLISGIRQINDSPSSIEAFMFRRLLSGVSETPEEACERITSVTRRNVIEAAQKVVLDTVYFLNGTNADGEDREDE